MENPQIEGEGPKLMQSVSEHAGAGADLKKSSRQRLAIDRLPPHSPEAEQGVLGCCLLSPLECIDDCVGKIDSSDYFYDARHIEIFETLVAMHNLQVPVDAITVQQWLKDNQMLEQIGGIAYLSQLQDAVPSAANLSYYLDIVREKFLLRKMIQTCTDVVGRIYDYEGEVDVLLDEVERDILAIRPSDKSDAVVPMKELVSKALERIEESFNNNRIVTGLATGFADLDRMTAGFHAANMITIAARPGVGKSSLAFNIAENIVLEQKLPVGFFSLEMTADELVMRAVCSCARVNLRNIREGFMADRDLPRLVHAAGKLSTAMLYIDDTSGLSIIQLRSRMRRMVQRFGIKFGVVDYLQLLHAEGRRAKENRQQEISDISNGIKALAKELRIPILVLSQLNRSIEREKRKPRLSDIRESGSVEQDSDVVGLLYKPDEGDEDGFGDEAEGVAVNLLIAKQRNGPTGEINLTFLKPYTRFESAAKVSESDVPTER